MAMDLPGTKARFGVQGELRDVPETLKNFEDT